MRILVVCQHYWPEPFRIHEICEDLVRRGHSVTALVGLPNYPSGVVPKEYKRFRNRKQQINGVNVIRCLEIGRKNTKLGLAVNYVSYMLSGTIKALLIKPDFDAIFAYSTSPVLMSMPAAALRHFRKIPLMIDVLDIWPACLSAMNVSENSLLYRFMRRVSRRIYNRADMLVYSSRLFKDYLKEVHSIDVPEEQYLPQFADAMFEAAGEKEPSDTLILTFAGNIGHVQNVQLILKAADILKDEDIHWHILGDGAEYENCRLLCNNLSLGYNVTMHGRQPVEEMPRFYAMSDAMLVTMSDNVTDLTLPGKVQSYMAAGKPVIGSIGGETPLVIKAARCGFCAPPDDVGAFAEAVRGFMALKNKRELGKNARAYYEKHFTKKIHMDRLENMLSHMTVKGEVKSNVR